VHGEHEHAQLRSLVPDELDEIDAACARHRKIEHRDVELDGARRIERFGAVRGFGRHLDIGCRFEDLAQSGANDGVIVREQHPDHARASASR
jgi:hypothetical protein